MVHDNLILLALQFGEKNNLNVNYVMHFSLMYMLFKNLSYIYHNQMISIVIVVLFG
jgi:hypothetical protein